MRLWRICREKYAALDGVGSMRTEGRWHNQGTAVVYTASTPSLCALEYLVHVDPDNAPADLVLMQLDLPDSLEIEAVPVDVVSVLHEGWRLSPGPRELQEFGSAWAASPRTPLLRVPSALLPVDIDVEANILINPALLPPLDVGAVVWHRFSFDPRLI